MGVLSDLGNWMKETAKERLNPKIMALEAFETLTDRLIPQGAAELAQALYTNGPAYVPYGPGQEPLPVEPAELGNLTPEPTPSMQERYDDLLSQQAPRGRDDNERGMGR